MLMNMPDLSHGTDADVAAVNSLRSAVMRLGRRLKHQRVDESLSPTEMSVLGTLARCGHATPGELARKEHVQPPSMTRIVALLEAKGLVRLEPHPDDRRQKVVTQTEQAMAMLDESRRKRNAFLAALVEDLDEDEWAKIRAAARPGRASMFSSLRIRNYRLFFAGQVVSNTGTWMQRIAQDWLVLSLTGSSAAVGITTALQFLPMLLFGLYGGVLVDRLRKRPTLLVTQSAMALTALALAALTLTGQVQVWHVYLAAFAVGLATVVDNPARQSFVSEMVGPEQLQNAVSLNSANFQSARLVGPAVAGVLITTVGTGWAFLYNGLSFIAPLAGLMLMRARELHVVE